MSLHLIKLCVGAESIADLEEWIAEVVSTRGEQAHTTRMVPKRTAELLDGGSLFWVIKGELSCRQVLNDVRPFTDEEGIGRCHLVMEPKVIPVERRFCRPFQGWRYLEPAKAPRDLVAGAAPPAAMPEDMRRELVALGLL